MTKPKDPKPCAVCGCVPVMLTHEYVLTEKTLYGFECEGCESRGRIRAYQTIGAAKHAWNVAQTKRETK